MVLWPAKGVSDYDRQGGIFYDPDADKAWLDAVKGHLSAHVMVRDLNCHINDGEFAEAATAWILEQLTQEGASHADV